MRPLLCGAVWGLATDKNQELLSCLGAWAHGNQRLMTKRCASGALFGSLESQMSVVVPSDERVQIDSSYLLDIEVVRVSSP